MVAEREMRPRAIALTALTALALTAAPDVRSWL